MTRMKRSRPSPAIIVAVLALVAALAGTAVAEQASISKPVTKKKVKKIAKKQAKKQINKLAPGLSVAHADTADTADSATSADSAAQVDTLQVDPENVAAAANQGAAPRVTLLDYGPFEVYGKCFLDGTETDANVYIRTTLGGAVLTSGEDDLDGGSAGGGYLNPGTLENNRELSNGADAATNDADSDQDEFSAVRGPVGIEGAVAAFAKRGTPAAGNGTYGAGNRCIFEAFQAQVGG